MKKGIFVFTLVLGNLLIWAACLFTPFLVLHIVTKWENITANVTRNVRIWQMSAAQRQCAEQFASNLAFVDKPDDGDSIAIGYLVGDDYYVAIYSVGAQGQCDVEFREKVRHLQPFGSANSFKKEEGILLKAVRKVRLSNSPSPDVYVWFETPGLFSYEHTTHIFFVEQPDSSYKAALVLDLCVGAGSVQITNERDTPLIVVTSTRYCGWPPDHGVGSVEYSLSDGTAQTIRRWGSGTAP